MSLLQRSKIKFGGGIDKGSTWIILTQDSFLLYPILFELKAIFMFDSSMWLLAPTYSKATNWVSHLGLGIPCQEK